MPDHTLTTVTDDSFERIVLNYPGTTVLLFETDWSGASHIAALQIAGIRTDLHEDIHLCRINTDANPVTVGRHGVQNIPTLLFYSQGQIVDHIVGTPSRKELLQKIGGVLDRGS
jgi:thioredoxin 1